MRSLFGAWKWRLVGLSAGLVAGLVISFALTGGFAAGQPASADDDDEDEAATVLKWDTMTGNRAPFLGAPGAIRGVNAAGAPWVVDSAEGKLKSDGSLKIEVDGLVLATTGVNPSAVFRARVSCLSIDASNAMTTVNLLTDAFPATPSGDAKIKAKVALPSPCIAPIVFVTSNTGSWFLSTGAD